MVLGIPLREPGGRYYNGLLSLGDEEGLYAKRHLVPFGELSPCVVWPKSAGLCWMGERGWFVTPNVLVKARRRVSADVALNPLLAHDLS